MNINIQKEYKSLPQGLLSDGLPDFLLITGINGAGKTHLLEYINQHGIEGVSQQLINFIPAQRSYNNQAERKNVEQYLGNSVSGLIKYIKTNQRNNVHLDNMRIRIEQSANKSCSELSAEEIRQYIPYDIQSQLTNELDLINLFISYDRWYSYESSKAVKNRDFERINFLHKHHEDEAPWCLINNLLARYNFDYRVCQILDTDVNLKLTFSHIRNPRLTISLEDLSSGEKQIVSLVIWAHNKNSGQRYQLLLLDEPDAYLHPSMCPMVIDILYNTLGKEYGIKTIMITHNPSTVAHAPEESIYVMQKEEPRFTPQDKASAIKILSEGIMTFAEGITIVSEIEKSNAEHILLTEGTTDIKHIEKALNVSNRYKTNSFKLISLNCADKLKQFIMSLPDKEFFGNKKIIAIFDADEEGIRALNNINSKNYYNGFYKIPNSRKYCLLLPVPDKKMELIKNCSIEFLYPLALLKEHAVIEKENLKKLNSKLDAEQQLSLSDLNSIDEPWTYHVSGDKSAFARKMAAHDNAADFMGFTPLFEKIDLILQHQPSEENVQE